MPFVLDASVTLGWFFRDEENSYAHGVLRRLQEDSAIVPVVWSLEVANGLVVAERRGRLTAADVAHVQSALSDLPIEGSDLPLDHALGAVVDLARTHGLSAYDASYLEVAMREGLPLATRDASLRTAAEQVGVGLLT